MKNSNNHWQQVPYCFGEVKRWHAPKFSLWKRAFAWPYLTAAGQTVCWGRSNKAQATTIVWGSTALDNLASTRIFRMEDGFIHSLGLGSDLSAPCSQVIDATGIYFDSQHNNDLFELLNHHAFDDALLLRAANLRQIIVNAGITKYNIGRKAPKWQSKENQRTILVVGQVADDASVRLGTTSALNSIDALLEQVWLENTDAFIVYKPHPDVLSGNRLGLVGAENNCHIVDVESDIISLIERVDEVHTLSSLAGFDALLRGKKVVTYGLPFYSGWGLTVDKILEIPYRTRKATLDTLVAATLILYPMYWDWDLQQLTTPEAIVNKLAPHVSRPLIKLPPYKRLWIKAWRWCCNVIKLAGFQLKQCYQN